MNDINFQHVDDWIGDFTTIGKDTYAKYILDYMRRSALMQQVLSNEFKDKKLFCIYKGKKYRVTMASRLGHIGLSEKLDERYGYNICVYPEECSEWFSN